MQHSGNLIKVSLKHVVRSWVHFGCLHAGWTITIPARDNKNLILHSRWIFAQIKGSALTDNKNWLNLRPTWTCKSSALQGMKNCSKRNPEGLGRGKISSKQVTPQPLGLPEHQCGPWLGSRMQLTIVNRRSSSYFEYQMCPTFSRFLGISFSCPIANIFQQHYLNDYCDSKRYGR